MVTTFLPQAGLAWKPSSNFDLTVGYAPDFNFYHSEPSEDFILHRGSVNIVARTETTVFDWSNSILKIDGSSEGPTWTGPGGAPAAGGIPLRDRRDALIVRNALKATTTFGNWIVRPALNAYFHDFQTAHRATPGYQNYADRNEVTLGADAGRKLSDGLAAFLGYRWGQQDQSKVLDYPEEYDSTFHRLLFGLEGNPAPWVKLAVSMGPEFRGYADTVPTTFQDRNSVNFYVDASATFSLGKADAVTVCVKQFEQPAFGGRSTYEDLTCDLNWRHKFGDSLTTGAGFRAYNTDFLDPIKRNDWIYGTSALLNYAATKNLNAELSYLYEQGESRIPNLAGREYERHVVTAGLKFKVK